MLIDLTITIYNNAAILSVFCQLFPSKCVQDLKFKKREKILIGS